MDLSTSVAAWMSSPEQHISLSAGMDFAFLRDLDFERELIVRAVCLDRNKAVARTTAEAFQEEELVATMHHTVFYMKETVKEVFRLSD
jgi:acyl-coenzyme A thioesterase PaaI-like protein